jgi:hypothetical protein
MIARVWRGEATIDNAPRYVDHLEGSVFPQLERLSGHEGAYLLVGRPATASSSSSSRSGTRWRPSTSSPVTTRASPWSSRPRAKCSRASMSPSTTTRSPCRRPRRDRAEPSFVQVCSWPQQCPQSPAIGRRPA